MSVKCIARERIRKAQEATEKIDEDLWGPIERLQRAGAIGNGAGIFFDVSLLSSALAEAAAAIQRTSAVPIYCAGCLQEIEMPCTYVIRTWPAGKYHLGCEPTSGFYRTAGERTLSDGESECHD